MSILADRQRQSSATDADLARERADALSAVRRLGRAAIAAADVGTALTAAELAARLDDLVDEPDPSSPTRTRKGVRV